MTLAALLPCGCYRSFCPACTRAGLAVGAWRAYRGPR